MLKTLKQQMRAKMFRDILMLGVVFLFSFSLAAYFDAFEQLHVFVVSHENLELDEFITATVILSFVFAIFSYRRWQDVRKISSYCERLSMIDPITMLPNRRLISLLLDDIREGKNKTECFPLSLILVDINGLENIQLQLGNAVAEQVIHELVYRYGLALNPDHLISYRSTNQCLLFCPQFSESEAEVLCKTLTNIELDSRQATLNLLAIQAVSVTVYQANEIDLALDKLEDLLHASQFDEMKSA